MIPYQVATVREMDPVTQKFADRITISGDREGIARIYACIVPMLLNPKVGCPLLADLGRVLETVPGVKQETLKFMCIDTDVLHDVREKLKRLKERKELGYETE